MLRFVDIQKAIRTTPADAWAMYDFRGSNSIATTILDIAPDAHCTRRWMVVCPAQGKPVKIVHQMEQSPLDHLKTDVRTYSTHQEWEQAVRETLAPYKTIAMEYSPNNGLPVVSKVDAGTVDMVRSLGHTVISSGNLAQMFTSVLSESQIAGAEIAAGKLRDVIFEGFRFIRNRLLANEPPTEFEVQQLLLRTLAENGMETDSPPIVAIGPNASMPHYAPSATGSAIILRDMVVLIDCWAKHASPGSVFADLTWVGYTSDSVPADVEATFRVITRARDKAVELVKQRFADNVQVCGYEVDDACRGVIREAGLASAFIHRTGHNITTEIHGPGVNMDNFETFDDRPILPGMSFSIEPGVYFAGSLGLRTEIDVIIAADGEVRIPSEPMQSSILPLLADSWEQ